MKGQCPRYEEGDFLAPQPFQQQTRWEDYANEWIACLPLVHPWGVQSVQFDEDALRAHRLKVQHLCLRFEDGTFVDTDRADDPIPTLALEKPLPDCVRNVEVLLALSRLPVSDKNGPGNAMVRDELSLRFTFEANSEYITCPIARLIRDAQGGWEVDRNFVPPLLAFSASGTLVEQLAQLLTQLREKRKRLIEIRHENHQRMVDFTGADVSLFWLLNALNSYEPILSDVTATPVLHPELVYRELVRLAGSLLTFSLDHDADAIPCYDHHRLDMVFPPLFALLSDVLDTSFPSRVMAINLERMHDNQWCGWFNDSALQKDMELFLSVCCDIPLQQLQVQFPTLCKVGAPDEVNSCSFVTLDGVPLLPLNHIPAAIPLRLENLYFALDLKHPNACAMMAAGCCAIHVSSDLGDVQLELFAVLRS